MLICPNCRKELPDGTQFCTSCGFTLTAGGAPGPAARTPVTVQTPVNAQANIPANLRPISAWGYWGLSILFAIPVVGFVFLIVFSCSRGNLHRRSFARSYWCNLILVGVALLVILIVGLAGVGFTWIEDLFTRAGTGYYY
ncbi:MAG: zinc-ribbon domain-containing protein [Lachnospiraceae bacterium]|jgi:hypothetical protein